MAGAREPGDQGQEQGSKHRDPALTVKSKPKRNQPQPWSQPRTPVPAGASVETRAIWITRFGSQWTPLETANRCSLARQPGPSTATNPQRRQRRHDLQPGNPRLQLASDLASAERRAETGTSLWA